MKHKLLTACGAVLVAASVHVFAITFGEPDGGAHPHVGTLIFKTPTGYYSCTGTLLSPTVMLTAGHCTEEAGQVNLATWVSFDPAISFAGIDTFPSIDAYLNKMWIRGIAVPHPKYDDYNAFPDTYDVGVVILRKRVVLPVYGALPPLGLLDHLATGEARKDREFLAVGYGLQGILLPFAFDDYARYRGWTSLVEVSSAFTGDQQSAKFTNNPGTGNGSGGTCYGDSGGPLFYGSTNMVGAIVSWGRTPCIGVDYQFRMDTPVAQDFVTPFLR